MSQTERDHGCDLITDQFGSVYYVVDPQNFDAYLAIDGEPLELSHWR